MPEATEVQIEVLRDLYMDTRDGARLGADIFLPKKDGPWPALVMRTPYGKTTMPFLHPWCEYLAKREYAVVLQDCRGTGTSEGEFVQYWADGPDGYDTVEWAAAQDWCDGQVGIFGSSYMGNVVYLVAAEQPPSLKAGWAAESGPNLYRDRFYRGGIPHYMESSTWSVAVDANSAVRVWDDGRRYYSDQRFQVILDRIRKVPTNIRKGMNAPFAGSYLLRNFEHTTYDDYWREVAVDERFDRVNVPVFHMGGWFDIYTQGTLDCFTGINRTGRAPQQQVMMGPWYHAEIRDQYIGPMQVGWFDHWLKGYDNGIREQAPVKIYVMGADPDFDQPQDGVWRDEQEWPLARTQAARLYLRSGPRGSSGSINDGRLTWEAPTGEEKPDKVAHDPDARELPGALSFRSLFLGGNNHGSDQRKDEDGGRTLTYTTDPLEQDLEVTGPISVELYASSTAGDADWVVLLADVYPDGTSLLRTDGLLKASHRDGHEAPTPLTPGQVYKLTIEVWSISQVFRRGHRIRLDVANSSFPKLEPNPLPAVNTVHHDAEHQSCVILPVIPEL